MRDQHFDQNNKRKEAWSALKEVSTKFLGKYKEKCLRNVIGIKFYLGICL